MSSNVNTEVAHPVRWTAARWTLTMVSVVAVGVPFLIVQFPPILDLAQQTAQIRLLQDAVANLDSEYTVHWFGPNKLSYLVLGIGWLVGGPTWAARLAMVVICASWAFACQWLAARRGRSASNATLACLLVFNHFLYMGYLNFALGLLPFVVWFNLMVDPPSAESPAWRTALVTLLGSAALFAAHSLWLAAGVTWFALNSLLRRHPFRVVAYRLAGLAPTLGAAVLHYLSLAQYGWRLQIRFSYPALSNFARGGLVDYAFGGVRGWLEPFACVLIFAWCAAAVWKHRSSLLKALDRPLAVTGVVILLLGFALPSMLGRTLQFGSRWVPIGTVLLLIAIPAPGTVLIRRLGAITIVAGFIVATSFIWRGFDRDEMRGFGSSLAALPAGTRLISLDFYRYSPRMKNYPYFHMHAYAQVFRNCKLADSFAVNATSLVVYKEKHREKPWSGLLGWTPDHAKPSDFRYFDYALIHSTPEIADEWALRADLAPVSVAHRWRLYRVRNPHE